ncbi:hypothetical protein [Staphylococcus phage VB-SauS-SA2]|nr:hypothetical protein [Staphylococcus phage VB-SauS-SA2]
MTNLKNKSNLNEFTKAYTDKDDAIYLVNKYNLSDEVQNTTDAFNEMTDEQINNAIQDTFITNNNGIFKYNSNDTIDYVNQHLLDCETQQDEIFVNVRGFNDSVEVVDVIGVIEEKGRIYVGLEIEYEEYCYLVNVNFMNVWDFVYKDEMVEIQDVLSRLISEKLKTDLGIQGTLLDDVKEWAEELANEYDNGQIGALNDLMQGGIQSGIVSHLIYNGDIMDFYDKHYTEIDEVLERDNKKNIGTIEAVWYAWEKVAYKYLETLESK